MATGWFDGDSADDGGLDDRPESELELGVCIENALSKAVGGLGASRVKARYRVVGLLGVVKESDVLNNCDSVNLMRKAF